MSGGALVPGSVFGRDFRIVKELRAGGMGAVYVVDQLSTGKQRALKVMAPELATDPSIRERFVLEARAAARIESDHVVEIVTAGVDEETGAPFLVMELLKGEELADALTRVGALPLGDVGEILAQVGHALEQAHANGIVHRDLKLENIFIASSRRRDAGFTAKVLDFGIAKLVADSQEKKTGTQPLGTPLFMSPEQTDRRGRICPATDVWALGLIAFRLLTGRDFWREADGSLPMLLREIVVDEIPPASLRGAELGVAHLLPQGFDSWFARCVNRLIDARFQEAGAAVRAFAELVTPEAPRGLLGVSGTGPQGTFSLPTGSVSASGRASIKVTPPGGATGGGVQALTVAATGGALVATGAPGPARGRKSALVPFLLGAGVLLAGAGGAAAFFLVGSKPSDATPPTASASATAVAPPPIATPVRPAGAHPPRPHRRCPEGSVLIPAGKMFMGARDLTEDAKPPHEVTLTAFCINRTEVTTEAYMACVSKGECEKPPDQVSWPGITPEKKKRYSPLCNGSHRDRAEHPINCVAWPMAENFCQKRKERLPTEAEWEFAARGPTQRKYPWGDEAPSAKYLNACGKECQAWGLANGDPHQVMYPEDDRFVATAPVGSFPGGASIHGVMDLAGNVWEWTADWYAPYSADVVTDPKGPATGTAKVARGGDYFGYQPDWARPAYRWKTDPEAFNHAIGFRCASDAEP